MDSWNLRVSAHNAHYEGSYEEAEIAWRAVCAADKARNISVAIGRTEPEVRSVLEIGCGTGAVLDAVKSAGIGTEHVGVDVADPGAHLDPQAQRGGLDLRQYDGLRLPFECGKYDLVYASHVLEHVTDSRGFLAEMRRVSKRYVYVEVPCEITLRTSIKSLQRTLDIGHINAYTPETFALTLATSGLKVRNVVIRDHSLAVHKFHSSAVFALIKAAARRVALAASSRIAPKVFCYHVGILCEND